MTEASLVVLGVRHHSPACARLVERSIRALRPRFVLVEGPAEMNDRIAELALGHTLPIALYSYLTSPDALGSRGAFSPFCAYSPEWVALEAARAVGATALFIDLPSYDPAFRDVENRYSDRHLRASDRMGELVKKLGFEDTDSLWDHLFEGPAELDELAARLHAYFVALRGDEPGGPRDEPREGFMSAWIAWAMRETAAGGGGHVLVVCGGYHAPVLERAWRDASGERPVLPATPPGARVGTYLVPYSFHRLDAFTGYQSGMPSPAYYQAVWEAGPEGGAERMVRAAIDRLRHKKQRVSAADLIGASAMTQGLMRVRGHAAPLRVDVLDGLAAALLKDAVTAPLPWTRRGPLAAGTDPMLVEVVAAFSGDRFGRLATNTPRPPLVDDAYAELASVGIALDRSAKTVDADLATEPGRARSRVLHRLRLLGIPEFQNVRAPSLRRGATDLAEKWQIAQRIETDAALIEAAALGATLEQAAHGHLAARAADAHGAATLVEVLFDAARAGVTHLGASLVARIRTVLREEPDLEPLGEALARLLALHLHAFLLASLDPAEMKDMLRVGYERAAWLFEGLTGADVPAHDGHVKAVVAMRDVLRHAGADLGVDLGIACELARRRSADPAAPSYVRGAALGLLAALEPEGAHESSAALAVRGASRPQAIGDFLIGLFALAREEVRSSAPLLAAIDASLAAMTEDEFLIAVPALRQAFAYFPPREKRELARAVLRLHDGAGDVAPQWFELAAPADAIVRGMKLDEATAARLRRFGLAREDEEQRS